MTKARLQFISPRPAHPKLGCNFRAPRVQPRLLPVDCLELPPRQIDRATRRLQFRGQFIDPRLSGWHITRRIRFIRHLQCRDLRLDRILSLGRDDIDLAQQKSTPFEQIPALAVARASASSRSAACI